MLPDTSLADQFNAALITAKIRALELLQQIIAPQWPPSPDRGICTFERFKLAQM